MLGELDEFVMTFEELLSDLESLEKRLAIRHGIEASVRETLIERDRLGLLEEDELVSQWLSKYSVYLDWVSHEASVREMLIERDRLGLLEEDELVSQWLSK